jgi:hypothetical protein
MHETEININGTIYVLKEPAPSGMRCVVVVDRGWIFAGNAATNEYGNVTLSEAIHVFRWESIGFDGMLSDPKSKKVTLKPMPYPVEIPKGSIIFKVPVRDDWGL